MGKIIAYLRVSTDQQDLNNQKHEIESYAKKLHMQIDEWVEVEISSRKNMHDRRIAELIQDMKKGDKLIVSEPSRLQGRCARRTTSCTTSQSEKLNCMLSSRISLRRKPTIFQPKSI